MPTTLISDQQDDADYTLMLSCPNDFDAPIAVARWFSDSLCLPAPRGRLFTDETNTLFLRWEFTTETPTDELRAAFAPLADFYRMHWTITRLARPRLLVLVSHEDHVLAYLLSQHAAGTLPADIVAVASNHGDTRPLVTSYSVPFEHIPWPALRDNDPAGQATAHQHLTDLSSSLEVLFVTLGQPR